MRQAFVRYIAPSILLLSTATTSVDCLGGSALPTSGSVAATGDGSGGNQQTCGTPWTGVAPLRRLTQRQYNASVQAILGANPNLIQDLTVSPTPPLLDLPLDGAVEAFAMNVVAPVSDNTIMQWQTAAQILATTASQNLAPLLPCSVHSITATCITQFVAQTGAMFYRRPLTASEVQGFAAIVAPAVATQDWPGAVEVALETMLQSPNFLYQVESGDSTRAIRGGTLVPLTSYELASRLSFLLWSSGPDAALMQAAAGGTLSDPNVLLAQLDRMMNDRKFVHFEDGFFTQYLGVDDSLIANGALTRSGPSFLVTFPGSQFVTMQAIAEMRQEVSSFADYVIFSADGTLGTMLSAPFTMMKNTSGVLSQMYGVPGNTDTTKPTQLDPTQRAGLLTQLAYLTVNAHPASSAPVLRGKYIRENILCQDLPPPPPGIGPLPASNGNMTTRQVVALHESNPVCASCHLLMDPLGLGFEEFDQTGNFRATDNGLPVDASGAISATTSSNGTFSNAVGLAAMLAKSPDALNCGATQLMRYAVGHKETTDDMCALQQVEQSFAASAGNFQRLLRAVVTSDSFRYLRVDAPGVSP